jgi:predicted small secreted protein
MNRFVLTTIALLLTVMTAACNTVAGAGQDMQKAGTSVEDEANENK